MWRAASVARSGRWSCGHDADNRCRQSLVQPGLEGVRAPFERLAVPELTPMRHARLVFQRHREATFAKLATVHDVAPFGASAVSRLWRARNSRVLRVLGGNSRIVVIS